MIVVSKIVRSIYVFCRTFCMNNFNLDHDAKDCGFELRKGLV